MVSIITEVVNTSLGALAGQTALKVGSDHETAMTRAFLAKSVRMQMHWKGATAGEGPLLIGLAQGTASVTKIKSAIEDTLLRDDPAVTGSKKDVLHESTVLITTDNPREDREVSLGGGKGIPFHEDLGFQVFAYDVSSGGLTTGSSVRGIATIKGVWL